MKLRPVTPLRAGLAWVCICPLLADGTRRGGSNGL
jgi:hypothetical protein